MASADGVVLRGVLGGAADDSVKAQLDGITDLARLDRMFRRAVEAASWQDILDTR